LKYKIVLFGVKTETYTIYQKFKDKIDLVVTLNSDEKKKYHISGGFKITNFVNECFETDDYKLSSKLCEHFFQNNKFEIGIVIGWQRLIPQKVLNNFNFGIFGFHGSPLGLPFGKGRSPVNWSIILGYKQVYNHCFQYNSKADDGLIYSTTKLEIFPWDDIGSMKKKSLIDFENTIDKLIADYQNDTLVLENQDRKKRESFFPKRNPKDGKINILEDSTELIHNLIRGVSKPFPGAFLNFNDEKCIIWQAQPFSAELYKDKKIGEITKVFSDDSFVIKTIDSTLLVTEYENIKVSKGMILS